VTDRARLDAVVHGRVQGVGFRMFVVGAATQRGLTGWVANEASGRVRCVAEGRRDDLHALLADLHEGPRGSHVERVDAAWLPANGEFGRFEVRSGWHPGD
jgi:acylphosphatase